MRDTTSEGSDAEHGTDPTLAPPLAAAPCGLPRAARASTPAPLVRLPMKDFLWLLNESCRLVAPNLIRIFITVVLCLGPAVALSPGVLVGSGAGVAPTLLNTSAPLGALLWLAGAVAASLLVSGQLLYSGERRRADLPAFLRQSRKAGAPFVFAVFVAGLPVLTVAFYSLRLALVLALFVGFVPFPALALRRQYLAAFAETGRHFVESFGAILVAWLVIIPVAILVVSLVTAPIGVAIAALEQTGVAMNSTFVFVLGSCLQLLQLVLYAILLLAFWQAPTVAYRRMALGWYEDRGPFFGSSPLQPPSPSGSPLPTPPST